MTCARVGRERIGVPTGWLVAVCSAAAMVSCGDDSGSSATTTGSEGGGGASLAPVDVTLYVFEAEPFADPEAPWPLVQGATVAIDYPDGRREEMVTSSEGEVLVEGVDLSAGKLRFSAHKPGYWIWSDELPEGETEWGALLQSLEPPEMVTISGSVANMLDSDHYLMVMGTTGVRLHWGQGPSFSIAVAKGKPFTLIVNEWQKDLPSCGRCWNDSILGWVRVDHDGASVDTELQVDMADAEPGVATQGRLQFAEGEDSVLLEPGGSSMWTYSYKERLTHGYVLTTHLDPQTTGFTFTAEHYELEGASDVVTRYAERDANRGITSELYIEGYPQDGFVASGLLHEPERLVPSASASTSPSPMVDGVEWIPIEPTDAHVAVARNGMFVWVLYGRDDTSRLEFPEPPSSIDRAELLGTEPLDAYLALFADRPRDWRGFYGKRLQAGWFSLAP